MKHLSRSFSPDDRGYSELNRSAVGELTSKCCQFSGFFSSSLPNNPDFKPIKFEGFKNESGANNFSLTPHNWSDRLIERLAKDLKGFSSPNLKYCKRFYLFHQIAIGQQVVDQYFQQCCRLASDGSSFTTAQLSNKLLGNYNPQKININKPMVVSEFQLTEILPDELKSSLPSIEEIENELKKLA